MADAVAEIYAIVDPDHNGVIRQAEYIEYLKGIHEWGRGKYRDGGSFNAVRTLEYLHTRSWKLTHKMQHFHVKLSTLHSK